MKDRGEVTVADIKRAVEQYDPRTPATKRTVFLLNRHERYEGHTNLAVCATRNTAMQEAERHLERHEDLDDPPRPLVWQQDPHSPNIRKAFFRWSDTYNDWGSWYTIVEEEVLP